MNNTASVTTAPVDARIGKHVPALSSALRPSAIDEIARWGGPRLLRGKDVLDLGCGDGRLAIGVAGHARSVVGLDPDPQAIAGAERAARELGVANARFVVGAAQELPFAEGEFDVVILSWTL